MRGRARDAMVIGATQDPRIDRGMFLTSLLAASAWTSTSRLQPSADPSSPPLFVGSSSIVSKVPPALPSFYLPFLPPPQPHLCLLPQAAIPLPPWQLSVEVGSSCIPSQRKAPSLHPAASCSQPRPLSHGHHHESHIWPIFQGNSPPLHRP